MFHYRHLITNGALSEFVFDLTYDSNVTLKYYIFRIISLTLTYDRFC